MVPNWITMNLPLFLIMLLGAVGIARAAEAPAEPAVDYALVVTGGELLQGVYPDSHTAFITRTLAPLGGHCVLSVSVDDRREDLLRALGFAAAQAPLVIVTGGLGPTPNDITRETLSEFTAIPVEEREELLADLERRFGQKRDQLRANLRRQTRVPTPGGFLKNAYGTAAGLVFDDGRRVVVALPGPPRELQPMVRGELLAFLQRRFGVRPPGSTLTLRFVGLGQSAIDQAIREQGQLPPDVFVTSLFEGGRVDFTFSLPQNSATNEARLRAIADRVRAVLGDRIYAEGDTSLEEVVVGGLARGNRTLALAEVGSGGGLAASLHRAAGIDRVLVGALVAPSEQQMWRLAASGAAESTNQPDAGEALLRAIATAARRKTGAAWVVVTSHAVAETGRPPAVTVALAANGEWKTWRVELRDSAEAGRANLVTEVLDRLRRELR